MGGIGESLRSTREAKGISLEQAEEDTKIRKKYLQALEDGDYDVIPGRVYAKGFLRNYANYLGLNQEEVMLEYRLLGVPAKEEHKRVDLEVSFSKKKRSTDRADKRTYLTTVLIAVFAIIVLLLYNFVFKNANTTDNDATDRPKTDQGDKKPANEGSDKSSGQPAGQNGTSGGLPGAGNTGTQGNNGQNIRGVNLTLNINNQDCWVKVTVDGAEKFTGTLKPGDSKTYSGNGSILVKVGNAGAAEAVVNGQNLGVMGRFGQVVTKEFSNGNTTGGGT